MSETLEQRRNRITRLRRERIMEYAKNLYMKLFKARDTWLTTTDGKEKEYTYDIYDRILIKTFMFTYGVSMADPNGKWGKRFNKLYDETYAEYYKKDTEKLEEDINNDETPIT